jgi:hypothetical protein
MQEKIIETALFNGGEAGLWSALFADYDQDGEQDIFCGQWNLNVPTISTTLNIILMIR